MIITSNKARQGLGIVGIKGSSKGGNVKLQSVEMKGWEFTMGSCA